MYLIGPASSLPDSCSASPACLHPRHFEPTDSERAERVGRLGVTETMMKPVAPQDAIETARGLGDVDVVRSGTMSPSLGKAIGTTYLPAASAKVGTRFEVECGGERLPAVVVGRPFWKKGSVRQ